MGAMAGQLPPASGERVLEEIARGHSFLTDETKWFVCEWGEGKKTEEEADAIRLHVLTAWAFNTFTSILWEWCKLGVPPDQLDALARYQIENLATHAEEWLKAQTKKSHLPCGILLEIFQEFLPAGLPLFREENRFRFAALRVPVRSGYISETTADDCVSAGAERPAAEADGKRLRAQRECPNRALWLKDKLRKRAWSKNDVMRHNGPDRKTVQKILDGYTVREDVLERLARALSSKYGPLSVADIPRD